MRSRRRHMQTESTKATSSHGARTVGAGKRLETIVRPTARPSARSRLAPYTPASPAPGSASASSSRASHAGSRSEEHTSELQSHSDLVCRLLLEKKKKTAQTQATRNTCLK